MYYLGEKVITRSIEFKPLYFNTDRTERETLAIEKTLVDWIMEKIPNAMSASGSTAVEKLENHLLDNHEDFGVAVDAAYSFVTTEKMTHYIKAIKLGAIKYTLSKSCTGLPKSAASGKPEATLAATNGGRAKTEDSSSKIIDNKVIGDVQTASRNSGEKIVGFEICPIFSLVGHETLRQVIQTATIRYANRES